MPLLTLDDAKQQLNIVDTVHDAELGDYVAGTVLAVERARGEVIAQRSLTEVISVRCAASVTLSRAPVISLTSVTGADGTVWDVDDLFVSAASGTVYVTTGPALDGRITIAYTAGYADDAIPADWQLAARILVQHLWSTQRGTQGSVAGLMSGGEDVYDPRATYSIPRKVLELLGTPIPGVA